MFIRHTVRSIIFNALFGQIFFIYISHLFHTFRMRERQLVFFCFVFIIHSFIIITIKDYQKLIDFHHYHHHKHL